MVPITDEAPSTDEASSVEAGAINNQACPLMTSILYVQSLILLQECRIMDTGIKICPSITEASMMET
jgi:hypothetical protein